jgi:clan AA aspartic protease (TIGR02281 family)
LVNYYEQGYKVKISIDGISKYYLLDTGASNLIINRDVERDLLINGSLTKKDYLGTELYSLANNQNVTAQLVRLNNIKIGEYVVNNVTAAIIDDGSLLCGIGLLEKFRKWELDNGEEMLILYR